MRLSIDAVMKDLFERDRPGLLQELAGSRPVIGFLSLELKMVEERVADLLVHLQNDSILHIEFQSRNDHKMPYRTGAYVFLAGDKYDWCAHFESLVVYVGREPQAMRDRLSLGAASVRYRVVDIRDFDARKLLSSEHPSDWVLAMLAKRGVRYLRGIVKKAMRLDGHARARVFTQLAVLSGLRGASSG